MRHHTASTHYHRPILSTHKRGRSILQFRRTGATNLKKKKRGEKKRGALQQLSGKIRYVV